MHPEPGGRQPHAGTRQLSQTALRNVSHDASILHPVFFTNKLKKQQAVVVPAAAYNPVAQGYTYQGRDRYLDRAAAKL